MLKIILSETEIQNICADIASKIESKLKNNDSIPVFIGVMKGALPFMMDIMKNITIPCKMDFIQVSSYEGTESTGKITLKRDIHENIKDKDVLIIEDIVDTGVTMDFLTKYIKDKYAPRSLTTITLLDKKCRRVLPFDVDIVGKEIPNEFVVGYGLDYNDLGRNSSYVYVPTKEEIEHFDELLKND